MRDSMRSVEARFNKKFGYPWVFLNDEPFDEAFKVGVRKMTRSEVIFGELFPHGQEWLTRRALMHAPYSANSEKVLGLSELDQPDSRCGGTAKDGGRGRHRASLITAALIELSADLGHSHMECLPLLDRSGSPTPFPSQKRSTAAPSRTATCAVSTRVSSSNKKCSRSTSGTGG